ncbi:MAG: FAD-binding oxidoreductase [Microbacterium sp.]|uniref:FAD-binding oxidoreductase n=1 Tax=Microbacterium sp. TaxID=51671 RepID=UPI003F821BAE
MTTTIRTGPVSDDGQLLHAEDAAAQACLAVLRLEDALARHGLRPRLLHLEVTAADAATLDDLVGIVRERLTCAEVPLHVSTVARLDPPGAIVGLWAEVDAADTAEPRTEPISHTEGHLMSTPLTASRPAALAALPGVLFPGDPGFDDARRPWNLAVDLLPAAVGVPRTVDEAAAIVVAASDSGLRVSPLSTGHLALSLREVDLARTVLLRLSALTGVTIDPATRTARVLGGTVWQDVADAAASYGLAALHGSAGDVAVAGYLLGGGLSFYGRAHGLATSTVRALDVVTAGGEVVRASADENSELFWGLRGGTGGLGVVVAVEIDLLPIADVYAGMLLWDLSRGPEVLRAWAQWTATAPESATTSLRFLRFPPLPELPPFLSGRRLVVIDGAILDDDERAAEILAPLRALGPEIDTFGRIPAPEVLGIHMDPPAPTPGASDHLLLADLPEEAVQALLEAAGPDADTPLMVAELRHLGGALARPIDAALAVLDGRFALFTLAAVPVPALFEQAMTAAGDAAAALRPWRSGAVYPNFTERRSDASAFFDADTRGRLARLRLECDPTGLWLAAHDI